MTYQEDVWGNWLMQIISCQPKNNKLIESPRGSEVLAIVLEEEKRAFNWRRSDLDTFWIDVQMYVRYGLEDNEIRFICRQQPGIKSYDRHGEERKAYAEMMRGLDKLKQVNFPEIFNKGISKDEQERLFEEEMMRTVTERIETTLYGSPIRWDKSDYGITFNQGYSE